MNVERLAMAVDSLRLLEFARSREILPQDAMGLARRETPLRRLRASWMNIESPTGTTTTANGVPASSVTCGSGEPSPPMSPSVAWSA
jgi:hypothetical protein